ncbi:hypothetical protein [Streptomyces rubellomurinus]|uniref:Uncharacterized protein n=1 Tax=Streptomyces rubellomurinus (strain ATCC 31215) TaxID=359131 RepID=A0A0F2T9B0_STRR3|nr:hypothetical protein [Streptomyces rubellomurinus]KJS59814.1 hypothetical protein VM95_24885 [Streptomyces rubellomurinus]
MAEAEAGSKGRGRESGDAAGGVTFGTLAAIAGAFLLSRIWRWAGQQTPDEHHAAMKQTCALVGLVLFMTLVGLAVAGRGSTVQRRWRYAMLGAFFATVVLPAGVVIPAITTL